MPIRKISTSKRGQGIVFFKGTVEEVRRAWTWTENRKLKRKGAEIGLLPTWRIKRIALTAPQGESQHLVKINSGIVNLKIRKKGPNLSIVQTPLHHDIIWPGKHHGDALKNLLGILSNGFIGKEESNSIAGVGQKRRSLTNLGVPNTQGDIFSIELMSPAEKTVRSYPNMHLMFVKNAKPESVLRITIHLKPSLTLAEREQRKQEYLTALKKHKIPIHFI